MRERNLMAYLFRATGRVAYDSVSCEALFSVVALSLAEAVETANRALPGSQYAGMNWSLPGVYRHALQMFDRCGLCGGRKRRGQFCGCFDNGCQ